MDCNVSSNLSCQLRVGLWFVEIGGDQMHKIVLLTEGGFSPQNKIGGVGVSPTPTTGRQKITKNADEQYINI